MADNDTTTPGATPPGDGTQPGVTPNSNGQAPNETQPPDTSKWTIEDWKRFALDRDGAAKTANSDAQEKRKKLKAFEDEKARTDEANRKTEEERLKQAGEHQKLAEQYKAELDQAKPQLETIQGKYTKLSELMGKQVEETIKDWPAEVKAFDPGKEAGVEARMEWVGKSKALVEKLLGTPARPGNRPNPPASGGGNGKDVVAELRSTGNYQRF
jgi:hypothetical protein